MIVPMKKVFIVGRSSQRKALLEALGDLGVIHLEPADPAAGPPGELVGALERLRRARRIIAMVEPAGEPPALEAASAVEEIIAIAHRMDENRNRLGALHREANRLQLWGELRREQLDALAAAGVPVRFYSVPARDLGEVRAECVAVLADLPGRRKLVGLVHRDGEPALPEDARPIEPPERDLPTVRAEAKAVDEALAADSARLAALARLDGLLAQEEMKLASRTEFAAALAGGLSADELFGVQGWVPADAVESLGEGLRSVGIPAGVAWRDPAEDEDPPTLLRYPRWARPIKGLFDVLGTLPGYREYDISGFFMIALPIFAAMLIGDAGYGLVFMLGPLLLYRRMVKRVGKPGTHLLVVVGAATLAWGVLTANYFGVTPADLSANSPVRRVMAAAGVLWRPDPEEGRFLIIKVSFIIGCIHLILAHLRQVAGYWPDQRAWSEIGWCGVLLGMLGVIWKLFDFPLPAPLLRAAMGLLGLSYLLVVLFSYPGRGFLRRIGLGFAASLLPLIGAFGDTMSYIRLMAVGLASYYIAAAFNNLGAIVAAGSPVLWLAGVPIILFGHALNIALVVIAIFAHGVRLNMLEFSNNAGVRWAGYAYQPFARRSFEEK